MLFLILALDIFQNVDIPELIQKWASAGEGGPS
jgi:hypothetical protein